MKVDGAIGNAAHYDRVVLRNLLVLRAPTIPDAKTSDLNTTQKYSVMLAVTDSQASKLLFVVKNAVEGNSLRLQVDRRQRGAASSALASLSESGLEMSCGDKKRFRAPHNQSRSPGTTPTCFIPPPLAGRGLSTTSILGLSMSSE